MGGGRMERKPTPEPFVIDPNALYPLAWLRERLSGVVELPTLLDRTGLRAKRKFRDAILGSELLAALERVRPYAEDAEGKGAAVIAATRRRTVRGRGRLPKPSGKTNEDLLTSKPFEP